MSIKRLTLRSLTSATLLLGLVTAPLLHASETLRIGYQKSSTLITLLKHQGALENALADQGVRVSWHEFPNGQPLLEALNVGNIDVSADVADTVPVFAQAAGADLTYFAQEAPSPSAQAILVKQHSPIKTLADLKGKKVAVTKAAGVHYLLFAALNQAGLSFSDIEAAYLTPADGRAAFENNNVDAWVTWEPFLSNAQQQLATRVLADGQALSTYQRYYLTSTTFAAQHPKVLATIFSELVKAGTWLRANPREAANILGPLWGNLDPKVVELANAKRSYLVGLVEPQSLGEQQKIADAFYRARLLPHAVDTASAKLWRPE